MASETRVRETREIGGFDSVQLRDFGELNIRQGELETLTVETERDLLDKVATEVRGGILVLEAGHDWLDRILTGIMTLGRRALRYDLTVRDLRRLTVSGRGTVNIEGLREPELHLNVSGAARISLVALDTDSLELTISGRADIDAEGRAERQRYVINGSGEVRAERLPARSAEVRVSGHGELLLAVEERLDVTISGYGRVRYRGDAQVRQQVSGAGTVERLEAAG